VSEPHISIVFPVYNQADHIADVIDEYEEAFSRIQYDHEFILVVNGCKDNSLDVCNGLAARYPSVRVVYSERGGWGLAVKLGLQQARGKVLGYTNSARTTASNLVLLSLYAIANPQAVVKAHRRSRESLERKAGSFMYNLECRTLFDLPTWDVNATPKVFTREVYNAIDLTEDGDLIDLEFYIKCKQLGTVILEVPIYSPVERHGGKSTTNYGSARRMYWGVFCLWRAMRMGRSEPTRSEGR
jgi:glycosyltransferase involved in cell wall biosynthesis